MISSLLDPNGYAIYFWGEHEVSDLANKNTGNPIKFEFQKNNICSYQKYVT